MAVELTPALLIRVGSGLLFVLLGAAVLALGRRRVSNVTFGVWAVAFGLTFTSNNLLLSDPATATLGIVLGSVLAVVSTVGIGVATFSGFGTGGPPRGRDLGMVAPYGAIVYTFLLVRLPASELYLSLRGLAPACLACAWLSASTPLASGHSSWRAWRSKTLFPIRPPFKDRGHTRSCRERRSASSSRRMERTASSAA